MCQAVAGIRTTASMGDDPPLHPVVLKVRIDWGTLQEPTGGDSMLTTPRSSARSSGEAGWRRILGYAVVVTDAAELARQMPVTYPPTAKTRHLP